MSRNLVSPIRAQGGRSRLVVLLVLALFAALVPASAAGAVQASHDVVTHEVPVPWTPHALDGRVTAIAEVGDRVVVGGTFTQIRAANDSTVIDRRYLFAFNARTGAIDHSFAPVLDDVVETVAAAPDGRSVFVGGRFATVDGAEHKNLVKLDLGTGAPVTEFAATPNRKVRDLVVSADRLYLAGTFTEVSGRPRSTLAAVDTTTGAVDPDLDLTFAGPNLGRDGVGTLSTYKVDVTPDGTRLVAIGNFREVDGYARHQLVLVDVAARPARVVDDWATSAFGQEACNPVFDSYMRDVDIAPDGSYFVVVTTGAYRTNELCDTASRWELGATGTDLQPTWASYTGGDTLYGVGVTGEAVYIGGHNRWVNNNFRGDAPGPGAIPRSGLAALDPRNGMPLSWNPGRTRGVGVFDIVGVDDGVYIGSDTDLVRWIYHGRLAKFPTDGWSAFSIPPADQGALPGDVYRLPVREGPRDPAYLHRVNTGGPGLTAADYGMDWEADQSDPSPYRNNGSRASGWSTIPAVDDSVPASAPIDLYSSERWDPGSDPEMQWQLPVEAGRQVEVRLYLANRYGGTDEVGDRIFDVSIDGTVVLDDFDPVADAGHAVGTMKAFTITSDGTVDIDFGHVTENPLVNGIEIVDPALEGQFTPPDVAAQRRPFDGATFDEGTEVGDGPADWSMARGGFMLSGRVYAGWADGSLRRWDFDGSRFSNETSLELYGLGSAQFPIGDVTGMSFDHVAGRLYYTVAGQARLYYREFLPESDTVGAATSTVADNLPGVDWREVRGLHIDGDTVYFGGADGNLRRFTFTNGTAGPVEVISGPDSDGLSWDSRGLFAFSQRGYQAPNVAPEPLINVACDGLDCTLGSAGSVDPDGRLERFAWDLGDGVTATGPSARRTFPAEGNYPVRLTVTDDRGGTATVERVVAAGSPQAAMEASCVDLACTFDGSASSDHTGDVVRWDWELSDGTTASGVQFDHDFAAAGAYKATLTVTDEEGATGTQTLDILVDEAPDDLALLGSSHVNANMPGAEVRVPDTVRGGDTLLAFVSVNRDETGQTMPDGLGTWTQVGSEVAGNLRTTVWHRIAETGDEGQTVSVGFDTWTKADISLLAYEGTSTTSPLAASASQAETTYQSEHTTPAVVTAAEAGTVVSYWVDRSTDTTDWTEPDGATVLYEGIGSGPAHVNTLITHQQDVVAGHVGETTAVASNDNDDATMWTIALAPRGYDPTAPADPVASFDVDCQELACSLDASASADPDGSLVDYAWDLGDGTTASGAQVQHNYGAEGTYEVTLRVTDDSGATATAAQTVTLGAAPRADAQVSCDGLTCTFDGTGSTDAGAPVAGYEWNLGDGTTSTEPQVTHTYAAAGTYEATLTVADDEGLTATTTVVVVAEELATEIGFVGASGVNQHQTNHDVAIPADVAPGDLLVLFASVNRSDVALPELAGWTPVDTVVAGSFQTGAWTRIAEVGDAGQTVRVTLSGAAKADVALAAYEGVDPASPLHAASGVAETVYRVEHTTPTVSATVDGAWVVSYWSDKTSGTTSWALPPTEVERYTGFGSGGGRVSAALADSGAPVGAGEVGGLTATADESNHKATMWTLVLNPRTP